MIGRFISKLHIVQATRVTLHLLRIIDKHGLLHIGIMGDIKIYDDLGYIYYLTLSLFKIKFCPFDLDSFEMLLLCNKENQKKVNKALMLYALEIMLKQYKELE